jgi:hypothetical protein
MADEATKDKTFVQTVTLTRRMTTKSKGTALKDVIALSAHVSAPTGFEITGVDVWEVKLNKDGDEVRNYDD